MKNLTNNCISIIPDHKEVRYGTCSDILRQLRIEENVFFEFLQKKA
ncbi:MAG: hypothetical protein Q8O99_03385 [bacterium]|nr:hypothetical protein [bacterium]